MSSEPSGSSMTSGASTRKSFHVPEGPGLITEFAGCFVQCIPSSDVATPMAIEVVGASGFL